MAEESRIAVFVDFENLAIGTRDMHGGEFRIDLVQKRLLEKGRIVFKRAYCDWNRYRGAVRDFHANGIEMIDIPSGRISGKNSADIRMVVDALDLCHSKGHIDIFALLTGDSDFSPLVNKLKENNKRVIGCGVKSSTSDLLVASCDEFLYYDDLVRNADNIRRNRGPVGRPTRPSPTSPVEAQGEAADTAAAAEPGTEAPRSRRKSRGRRSSKSRGGAIAAGTASQDTVAAQAADEFAQPSETTEFPEDTAAPAQQAAAETEAPEEAPEEAPLEAAEEAPAKRKAAKKKATSRSSKAAKEETGDEPAAAAKPSRTTKASRSKAKVAKETTDGEDAKDDESAPETAPAKAPRARRTSSRSKANTESEPEAEAKPDLASEAVDRLVAIVTSLSQDYDPVWGSLAKQTLHRVHPDFSEERYGYAGFKDLLLDAEKRGYVALEYDQGRGNYKIRVKN